MSEYIDSRTHITDDNATECAMGLRELERKRDWFVAELREQPVVVNVADLRYVFSEIGEVDALIARLDELLSAYCRKRREARQ